MLGACLLALAGTIAAQPPGQFEQAALGFVQAFPDWLRPVWGFAIGLLILWSVVLLVAPLFARRWRITVEALLAVVLAALLSLVAARLATGNWPGVEATSGLDNGLRFPSARIAVAAAVIAVANAHLARPLGSIGRWLLLLGAVAAVLNGDTTIAGTIAAILIGLAAGAAIRLALGTSAGRPSIADVGAALEGLGVAAHDLRPSERQVAGVVLVYAKDASGGDLAIKVYGRDAYDNQLLAKGWRTLWYRDADRRGSGGRVPRSARRFSRSLRETRACRRPGGRDGRRDRRRRLAAGAPGAWPSLRVACRRRGRRRASGSVLEGRDGTRRRLTSRTARSSLRRCASTTAPSRSSISGEAPYRLTASSD